MNENNSPKSKSESTNGSKDGNISAALQKGYGYVGLIAIVLFAYWLLSPKNMYLKENPRPYILNEKYYHKTMLSEIVILFNSGHAYEVKYAGERLLECEDAKKSISNGETYPSEESIIASIDRLFNKGEKLKAFKLLLLACTKPYIEGKGNIERAMTLEPKYWDLIMRYQELRKTTENSKGLAFNKENNYDSVREMILIYERLDKIRGPLIERSTNQLIIINGISHVAALFFLGIGIYFRRALGRSLLAPFGWIFAFIRKFHEKI